MSDDSLSSSVVNRTDGVDFHAQTINVYGDVVGGNKSDSSTPARSDTRERYLEQIIRYHRDLDFVGIPELKDRQALQLEEVFIHLQAEIEVHVEREPYLLRREEIAERLDEYASEALRRQHEMVKRKLSVNDALRDYPRMVVLGDPGAGKTTLLKYITLAFAMQQSERLGLTENRLPIFIRLYDYVAKRAERQTDYSLVDYLCTQAHENLALSLDADFFQDALERGECCVCLDGLDELGGAWLRREVIAAVNALVNKYPRNRYLITSRLVGYEEAPLDKREFVHHTVLPFGDDDIHAFVTKWYDAREKDPIAARERSKHLIDTIMRGSRIKTLAANPLMLTIIALVHRIEAELPHERVRLYEKCVTAMIQTWEEVKGLRVEDRQRVYYKQRRRLLEQLAYWMHSQPGERGRAREIKEGDLKLQIRRFLLENPKLSLDDETAHQEAHDFVQLVKGRTGLLIERGEGVYSFAHLTFQEYLAAADIEHRLAHSIDAIWSEIQPRLHDAHWREVILLLLGSLNKFEQHPTELIRRIFESTDEYEPVIHRHLYLAARALADRVEVETKLQWAIIDQLMNLATALEEWLHDDALAALGSLQGNHYAAQRLLTLAQDLQMDAWVRESAATAFGQLGRAAEAAPILLALAQNPQVDKGVRHNATVTLGELGCADNPTISGLLVLAQDPQVDADVRTVAAWALGELGHVGEVVPILFALAQNPQVDTDLRFVAAQALGELGRVDEVVPILFALVESSQATTWGQHAAAQALSKLSNTDVATRLLLDLTQSSQATARVRCDAAQALGQLGKTDEAIRILLALAQDSHAATWVRRDAAQALGQLGKIDEAVSILLVLARDLQTATWVRRDAAQALGQLGHINEATSILFAIAQDSQVDASERSAVARILGELGRTDEAALIVLTLIRDSQENASVQCNAARALGQLGHVDEAAPILLTLTQDSQVDVGIRRHAYNSLKSLLNVES
jgi:thioredoxin-like negative regulator of GroEL